MLQMFIKRTSHCHATAFDYFPARFAVIRFRMFQFVLSLFCYVLVHWFVFACISVCSYVFLASLIACSVSVGLSFECSEGFIALLIVCPS